MKFTELALLTTFLRSSMRRWRDAKMNNDLSWLGNRCDDCQMPLYGTNTLCLICYNTRLYDTIPPEEEITDINVCLECEYLKDDCRCVDGKFIPCRVCGDNCVDGDMPRWGFCSGRCMRWEARQDRYAY